MAVVVLVVVLVVLVVLVLQYWSPVRKKGKREQNNNKKMREEEHLPGHRAGTILSLPFRLVPVGVAYGVLLPVRTYNDLWSWD
jgi:ABC-type Fe3+ transport system permease subunit